MGKLDSTDFENVVIFSFSEPGAMGPNDATFYRKDGRDITIDYQSDETPYAELKEAFPVLKDCYFDGPMRYESTAAFTIVIGESPDDKETKVAPGWRHWYLDYGNHLVFKEELYYAVKDALKDMDNCERTFRWANRLQEVKLSEHIDEYAKKYFEQKEKDEHLARVLEEVKCNPEYLKRVKQVSDDLDAMMDVFEEFTGIRMTWVELKQFAFRQNC